MKSSVLVLAVVLGLNYLPISAAQTVVDYAAAEKPSSLADGKVTLQYDESGAVRELSMKPGLGETLALKGDGLAFAPGAKIFSAQGGVSALPAVFSAAGALQFGEGKHSWSSASLLPKDRYELLFRNVRLENVSPVSGKVKERAKGGTVNSPALPYWVRRSGDVMEIQFQCSNDKYVKGVHVELKQIGDDVWGKIVKAGYFKDGNYVLGYDLFYDPRIVVTHYDTYASEHVENPESAPSYAYGLCGLDVGPRRETYDFSAKFLSDKYDTTVATDVSLDELEFLYAVCGYNKKVRGIPRRVMEPFNVKRAGGVLSAQFQMLHDATLKCSSVELRQSGSDIVARIGYAKYLGKGALGADFDVEGTGTPYFVMTEEDYTEKAYGYSVDMLALRRKSRNQIEIPVDGTLNVAWESTGCGAAVTFKPAEGCPAATVNFTGAANNMTDSAFVVKAGAENRMTAVVKHKNALPVGWTEVYGNAELWLSAGTSFANGISSGASEIVMHPGSRLYQKASNVIRCQNQPIILDAAEFLVSYNSPYLNNLTLKNGASIALHAVDYVQAGHVADICRWHVTGTGASTNYLNVVLVAWGKNADGKEMDLTIDVEDVTESDDADFVMHGGFSVMATYPNAGFIKAGEGTMLLNGAISPGGRTTRVVDGTLTLGASGVASEVIDLSLEGGCLASAAGTGNALRLLSVGADAAIKMGESSSLSIKELSLAPDATLDITSTRPVSGVVVKSGLDEETVGRIRINGKECVWREDGKLTERTGMAILLK